MRWRPFPLVVALATAALLAACASSGPKPPAEDLRQQVFATEEAFARTMAVRDHEAFTSFLSEEAVFFSGSNVLRGKEQVAEGWKAYFASPEAPFSWKPERVEVLDSGHLALSTGPVTDP